MIFAMADVWNKAITKHEAYVKGVLSDALSPGAAKPLTSEFLCALLKGHEKVLAIGVPSELKKIIAKVKAWEATATTTDAEKTLFANEAKAVFDYDVFSMKAKTGWNAYKLTECSTYRMCPYCQQAYAFTFTAKVKRKDGRKHLKGFRPTLDHFFPKSAYPFLALSLYNLVPACQICNSSLKSTSDFYANPHLHPLCDSECLSFELEPKSYLRSLTDPTVALKLAVVNTDSSLSVEALASVKTFLLEKRYARQQREVRAFISTLHRWTAEAIRESAANPFALQGRTLEEHEALLLQFNYREFRQEMLGCIKRDLVDAIRNNPSRFAIAPKLAANAPA